MDYIIKNIYKIVINFTASKEDKESVYRDLFNKSTKASSVVFARNWEADEKATDVKDVVYHDDYYVETSNNNRYGAINFLKLDKHFRASDRIWNSKYTNVANEDYKLNNYTFISEFSK